MEQQRLVEDRLWELIEPLLPEPPPARGPGGRPRIDDRAALEGILFVLSTGCRWRDLPPQLGCGSGHTAWRRLRAWQDAGVWGRLHRLVLDELSDTDVLDRPIRILAGSSDDYNPAAVCASYVERLKGAGRDVTLTVYPDAQHVFDNPIGPDKPTTVEGGQTVRGCTIREQPEGQLINASTGAAFTYADPCVERGPHIGSDAGSRAAALQATTETLRAVFKLK